MNLKETLQLFCASLIDKHHISVTVFLSKIFNFAKRKVACSDTYYVFSTKLTFYIDWGIYSAVSFAKYESINSSILHTAIFNISWHTLIKPAGPGRKKRKYFQGCYRNLRRTLSSREAVNKVSKVSSFCMDCPRKPGVCLPFLL